MKKLLVFALVLGSLLFTSCATHMLSVSHNNLSQTETVLTQKNFKVVGQVQGEASATYILGIGGLSKKALNANAIAEMYENANLTGSQTIINVYVKKTVGGVMPFYTKNTHIASGTIIEFTE